MNDNGAITVEADVHFSNGHKGRKRAAVGEKPAPATVLDGTVPRLSRLMALAIRFDRLLRDGVVKDYAELARLGQVTRARLTQIMNLLNLAPDIQEDILFLPPVAGERAVICERQLRAVAKAADWRKQRNTWADLLRPRSGGHLPCPPTPSSITVARKSE